MLKCIHLNKRGVFMLKDRGNIKWTGLMLTEHRKKLEEMYGFDKTIEKPILDEQQLERLDCLIKEAIKDQFNVKIVYYENRKLNEITGKLILKNRSLYLDNKMLQKDNIIDVILI